MIVKISAFEYLVIIDLGGMQSFASNAKWQGFPTDKFGDIEINSRVD